MPELNESYFLSGFLGSLKDEIRLMVRMFKPNTMAQAVEIARLQERILDHTKRSKFPIKPYTTSYNSKSNNQSNNPHSYNKPF